MRVDFDKLTPAVALAERAVIGGCVLDWRQLSAIPLLEPRFFDDPRWRLVFTVMRELHKSQRRYDLVTVVAAAQRQVPRSQSGRPMWSTAGAVEEATRDAVPVLVPQYARIVQDAFLARALSEVCDMAVETLDETDPLTAYRGLFILLGNVLSKYGGSPGQTASTQTPPA